MSARRTYDAAEKAFRDVLAADPENAGAMNYLGYMFADRGIRLDEAQQLISKALDLEPGNGAYEDSLGWVYYRQNKLDQAADELRLAVDKVGERSDGARSSGRRLLQAGQDSRGDPAMGSLGFRMESRRPRRSGSCRAREGDEEARRRESQASAEKDPLNGFRCDLASIYKHVRESALHIAEESALRTRTPQSRT